MFVFSICNIYFQNFRFVIEPSSVEESATQTEPLRTNFTNQSASNNNEVLNINTMLPSTAVNVSDKVAVSTTVWGNFFKFAEQSTRLELLSKEENTDVQLKNDTFEKEVPDSEETENTNVLSTVGEPQQDEKTSKRGMLNLFRLSCFY